MISPFNRMLTAILAFALPASVLFADVSLPGVFGDHMVLQREMPVPVWGTAAPGESVTVSVAGKSATAKAGEDGAWSVKIGPLAAGGPHTFVVEGKNRIDLKDVLVGEVWLGSGQSNMAMTVNRARDFDKEQAAAELPQIRMFTVARKTAEAPQQNCGGSWQVCSPETVGGFSAAAYFFGRRLHRELNVPVGLFNSSWGGTPVQSWTPLPEQLAEPKLKPLMDDWAKRLADYDSAKDKAAYEKRLAAWSEQVKKAKAAGKRPPRKPRAGGDPRANSHRPANLYNGMIAPLAPYAIRGAIWYQGESNASRYQADLYGMQLAMMIGSWRRLWGQGDFPFLWVQLPNFKAPQTAPSQADGWVTVQDQMRQTLSVPNTGMAITIDIGEAGNIHPKNKQEAGSRLAQWALAKTYGKDLVPSGPLYRSMKKQGRGIAISFDYAVGLVAKGGEPKGFAIAGADRKFVWAQARIEEETVVVSSPEVTDPVAVRYAWAPNPTCNLYNGAGLPASPFRTDTWEK